MIEPMTASLMEGQEMYLELLAQICLRCLIDLQLAMMEQMMDLRVDDVFSLSPNIISFNGKKCQDK